MEIIKTLFPCLPTQRKTHLHTRLPEKQPFLASNSQRYPREKEPVLSIQEASYRIATILLTTKTKGSSLECEINSIVYQAGGWRESLATSILSAFEQALQKAFELKEALSPVIQDALAKVMQAGKEVKEFEEWFVEEHPVWTGVIITLVALGILWLIWPYILSALGFGEAGITEGSWAALWQSTYRGMVPKGSLFSYLQRLGATIGRQAGAAIVL